MIYYKPVPIKVKIAYIQYACLKKHCFSEYSFLFNQSR